MGKENTATIVFGFFFFSERSKPSHTFHYSSPSFFLVYRVNYRTNNIFLNHIPHVFHARLPHQKKILLSIFCFVFFLIYNLCSTYNDSNEHYNVCVCVYRKYLTKILGGMMTRLFLARTNVCWFSHLKYLECLSLILVSDGCLFLSVFPPCFFFFSIYTMYICISFCFDTLALTFLGRYELMS